MSRTLALASGSVPGQLSRAPGAAVNGHSNMYARRGDVEGHAAGRPGPRTNNMPPPPQNYWRPQNVSDLSPPSTSTAPPPVASTSTMQVEPFQSPPSLLYRRSLVEDPAFSRNSSSNPERWAPQGAIDPDFLRGSYVVPFPAGVLSPPPNGAQHSPDSEPSSFASSSTSLGMRPSPTSVEDEPPSARLAYLDGDESPQSSPEHTHIILPSPAAREKMREVERERAAVAMGAKEREAYDFARNNGSALQRAPSSGKGRDLPPAPLPSQAAEECPPYEESVSPGTGSTTLAGHPVNRLARTEKGAPLVLSYHAPAPPPSPSPEPPSMPLRKPDNRRVQVQEPEPTLPDHAGSSKGKQARKPAVARRHSSKPPPRDLDSIDELDESSPYNVGIHHRGPYDAIARGAARDPRAGKPVKAHRPVPTVDNPLKLNLKPGQVLSGSIFQPPSQHQPSFSQPLNIFAGPSYQPAHGSRPHPHFAGPPHESPYVHAHSLSTPRGSHSSLHAASAPAPAAQPAPPMPYLDPALFPDLTGANPLPPATGGSSTSPASLPTASASHSTPNLAHSNSGSSHSLPSSHSNSGHGPPSNPNPTTNPNTHSVNATFPPNRRTSLQSHSYTSSPNGSQVSLESTNSRRGAHDRPPSFVGAKRPDSYHAGQVPGTDMFYGQGRQQHDSFFGPQTPPQLPVGLGHARVDSAPSVVQRGGSYQEYQHPPQPQPPMPTPVQLPRDRASMPPPSPLGAQFMSAPEFPPPNRGQSRHVSMPPPASPAMVAPPLMVTPPGEEPSTRYEAPSSRLAALNASGGVYGSNLDVRTGSNVDVRSGSMTQLDPRSVSSIDVRSARTGASSVRTGGSQGPLAPRHIPRKLVMPTPLSHSMPAPPPQMMSSHSHSNHGHESHSPGSNHGHGSNHGQGSNHGHGGGPAAPPYLPRGAAPPAPDGAPAVRFAQAAVQPVPLPIPPTRGREQPGLKKAATIARYDEASRGNLLKKKNMPAPSERARSVSPVKEKGGFLAAIFGFGEGGGKEKGKDGVRRAQSVAVREAPVADVRRSATMKVGKEEKEKPRRLLSKRR